MRFKHYFVISCFVFLSYACSGPSNQNADLLSETILPVDTSYLNNSEDSIRTDIPAPIKGIPIHPDSVAKPIIVPLRRKPKVVSAHTNVHPAGTPEVIMIPRKLTVRTPGRDGVPEPIIVRAKRRMVPAQQPKPILALAPRYNGGAIYDIQHVSDEQGLGNLPIIAMVEDHRGHIWLGTMSGAYRYDGKNFFHYTNKEGLEIRNVQSMVEDSKGNIWFAGALGICYYDGQNFVHFTTEEGLDLTKCHTVIEDSRGNIWFGNEKVIRYDGQNFTVFNEAHGLTNDYSKEDQVGFFKFRVNVIMEDSRGHIWWGTHGSGVSRFDGQNITQFTEKEGLIHNYIGSILEDKQGQIWFGSGVSGIPGRGVSCYKPNANNNVDNTQNMYQEGTGSSFTNFTKEEGLSSNSIWDMMEDERGNIWFATHDGGLSRFDPPVSSSTDPKTGRSFTHFTVEEGLSINNVSSIIKDSSGNIWIGTSGGGVSRFNPGGFVHFTEKQGLSNTLITSILEDNKGNLWMGSDHGGVVKYDGQNFTYFSEEEGLSQSIIYSILEDRQGQIWFGTRDNGVSRFDGKVFTNYSMEQGLSGNLIWDMTEDSLGRIWFASGFTWEVSRFNPNNGQFTHFVGAEGERLGGGGIMEDSKHNIWVGGEGFLRKYNFESDQLNFSYEEEILNKEWIDGTIIEDSKENLWFMSDTRISQLIRNQNEEKNNITQVSAVKYKFRL